MKDLYKRQFLFALLESTDDWHMVNRWGRHAFENLPWRGMFCFPLKTLLSREDYDCQICHRDPVYNTAVLRTGICHCCLHPSFSFFFLIFLSNDADFFDVELCMGMYGGMGISVSNTDVCRGDTCLWRRKKLLLKGKFVHSSSPINLFAGGKVQDWLLSHRLSISPNVGVPVKAK